MGARGVKQRLERWNEITKVASISLILFILCPIAILGDDIQDNYEILRIGDFHGDDITIENIDGWYGLFKNDSGHALESVKLKVEPWHDIVIDRPGETTGVSIRIERQQKPLILVRGPKEFITGVVPTTFSGRNSIIPGKLIRLDTHILTAFGHITDEGFRQPGDLLILGYQVSLFKSGSSERPQTLVKYDRSVFESLSTLLWAGDLDRDGRIDFLLNIRNHYAVVGHYALYLSTEAENNDMVKLVAELFLRGS